MKRWWEGTSSRRRILSDFKSRYLRVHMYAHLNPTPMYIGFELHRVSWERQAVECRREGVSDGAGRMDKDDKGMEKRRRVRCGAPGPYRRWYINGRWEKEGNLITKHYPFTTLARALPNRPSSHRQLSTDSECPAEPPRLIGQRTI